ncbi:MAG: hemerythrin family protein [Verrucomicrobia bacterium]|nr:hemerythrin family protein [Deltaproteobacteria bacterium]
MGIAWRESLSIGIEEIDNQHKQLLSHFDQLLKACETGKGMDELKTLIDFLNGYVKKHFSDEEGIQRLHRYPGYATHKLEHDSFVARLNTLKLEIANEGVALHHVIETNQLLLTWLIHHISTVDVQLGRFLKNAAV